MDTSTKHIETEGSVGLVRTRHWRFAEPPGELALRCGEKLGPIDVAYETYGELTPERDNAILICHALSGDAHVAGRHLPGDAKPGWWDIMVGPGKPIDTLKYFVICSNILGGCKGTTGPSSVSAETGKPYALSFPMVTVQDMVRVQHALVTQHLGVARLLCVIGGSFGGMQVLQWAIDYPDAVFSALPIASTARMSAQAIAFDEVGRQAIYSDPNWNGGDYYGNTPPHLGLAVARMIGHITYLSDESMHESGMTSVPPTSRSRATCGIKVMPSCAVLTPTVTSISPRRWTISTSKATSGRSGRPFGGSKVASLSSRSRVTGSSRRINRAKSCAHCTRAGLA